MSFLNLPREIRNHIYFHVIHLERDPPSLRDKGLLQMCRAKNELLESGLDMYYEDRPLPQQYLSLSYTNSQIRSEIKEAVKAVRDAGNLTYKLDLMVDGMTSYPTWLSIPAPAKNIAELSVHFRRVGNRQFRWVADEGPGRMTGRLGRLLLGFMADGLFFFRELQPEWCFEVLSVRVVDREMPLFPHSTSARDFDVLCFYASLIAKYNMLG